MALKKWVFGTKLSQQITEQNANIDEIDAKLNDVAERQKIKLLSSTDNLNNITATGLYQQNKNLNATLEKNYPSQGAGILEVVSSMGHTYQRYSDMHNTVYTRSFYGGTWTNWKVL